MNSFTHVLQSRSVTVILIRGKHIEIATPVFMAENYLFA